MNWEPIIPSIVGGLLTGTFAITAQFFATRWTYNNNTRLGQRQQQKRTKAILQAIRIDFEIAYEIYYRKAGKFVEQLPDGQPYFQFFKEPESWLIVYPNHTEVVGQLNDPELSKAIMLAYYEGKYVIDGLQVNNWYLERIIEMNKLRAEGPNSYVDANYPNCRDTLVKLAPGLKKGNHVFKASIENVSQQIDRYLSRDSEE
jgi:hypothetical protein